MSSASKTLPVVILISGTGSNMCRMAELMQAGQLPIDIKAVISDRADAQGLSAAKNMGIATASLNPKAFATRNEFDAALAEKEHGASVHFVTAELDGGPVVVQAKVPIHDTDTAATLAQRVLQQEHQIYPLAVRLLASGRLESRAGTIWLDNQPLTSPLQYTSHLSEQL